MKWKTILFFALFIVCVLLVSHRWLLREASTRIISEALNVPVKIVQVRANVLKSEFEIKGIEILSPDGSRLEIDRVFARYKLSSLLGRRMHFPAVDLNVDRIVLVVDEHGNTKIPHVATSRKSKELLQDIPAVQQTPREVADSSKSSSPRATPSMNNEVYIEWLALRLRELELRDYSRNAATPDIRTYRLNYERIFNDVHDLQALTQALSMDLAFALGPQLLRDGIRDSDVSVDDLLDTITNHEGDLEALGRKLDEQTKDLQRELRRQLRGLRGTDAAP